MSMYEGAFVKCWRIGLFLLNVFHIDVKSMYPSIMIMLNLSPDSIWVKSIRPYTGVYRFDRFEFEIPDKTVGQVTCGISEEDGETRRLLIDLFEERDRVKGLSDLGPMEKQSEQLGIKLIMNAVGYGYHGLLDSRYGFFVLAVVTTAVGRLVMKRIIAVCKANGVTLLENDTDGLYVQSSKCSGERLEQLINADLHSYFSVYGDFAHRVRVELNTYDAILLYAAKNYVLKKDNTITFRGSGFHGRGLPLLCYEALNRFARAVFSGENTNRVWAEFVNLRKFPLKMFTMSASFGKSADEYAKTTLYADIVAKLRAAGHELRSGEEVYYVKLSDGYWPVGSFPDSELLRRLDVCYYYDRLKEMVQTRILGPSEASRTKKMSEYV